MTYPKWTDFPIEEVIYGVGAPYCGIGVYTIDRRFSWPDMSSITDKELSSWKTWLIEQEYEIPETYRALE